MLLALAELLQVVRAGGGLVPRRSADARAHRALRQGRTSDLSTLPAAARHLPPRGGATASGADLALVPGDRLTLFWQGGPARRRWCRRWTCDGVAFDRSSPLQLLDPLPHRLAAREVRCDTRFPGSASATSRSLSRGVSGRVGKIRIHGDDGETVEVEGLAVRWTLDVPDTLFTAKRLEPPRPARPAGSSPAAAGGTASGMCQVGSYGMAQRGHGYRDILAHYYTGVELGRVKLPSMAATATRTAH